MANIDNVQLPDGSSYNIVDNTSGFATQNYVDSAVSSVTKTTIGLGNVDNTSDLNKPVSTAQQAAIDTAVAEANVYRNFLFIADSYGMREESQPTWTQILTSVYTNSRQKSVSSIGFTTGGSSGYEDWNFIGQLKAFNDELSESEKAAITDIVVCGGWNDARELTQGRTTPSALTGKIEDFVDYAAEHFINAKVWIGFISWQSVDCPQTGADGTTLNDLILCQDLYENKQYENLYHLANVGCVMKCSEYLDSSFFHPNAVGSQHLAEAIASALNGGYAFSYLKTLTSNDFVVPAGSVATLAVGTISMNGDTTTIRMVLTGVQAGSSTTILEFDDDVLPGGALGNIVTTAISFPSGKGLYIFIEGKNLKTYTAVSNEAVILTATYDAKYVK